MIIGTYYDMVDFDQNYPLSSDSSFNPDKFLLWAATRRNVKVYAHIEGVSRLNKAAFEMRRINKLAKLIKRFYTATEAAADIKNGTLIPYRK